MKMIDIETEKHRRSISLSNMAGPRERKWVFQGKTSHWVTMTTNYYFPELTFNSMHDTCKITLSGDASKFKDFKLLLGMIEQNMISE